MTAHENWWERPKGERHHLLIEHVQEIERTQGFLFERFHQLSCLYDPYYGKLSGWDVGGRGSDAGNSVNVIASSVDTVAAVISATEVRARFMTDDGDWSTQRMARNLEWYTEGLGKLLGVAEACRRAFKEAALKTPWAEPPDAAARRELEDRLARVRL